MTSHDLPSGDGPRTGRPKRRTFSAAYKLRMVEEYDAAEHGDKGALLRREGLYESSVQLWRRQRDTGELTASGTSRPAAKKEDAGAGRVGAVAQGEGAAGAAERRHGQETQADRGRPGHHGKRYRALGNDVRERGHREFVTRCRNETLSLLAEHLPIRASCALSDVPRSSCYRRQNPVPDNSEPTARPTPPNALSESERAELVEMLNSDRFADKAPRQVWAALLDEGVYLASVSTMYRELRRRDQVRERRAQARHQARTKPYLAARAPNQTWSWDITKLPGPEPRQFYDLHVMLDIFSRFVVHWEVHLRESGELAEQFMQNSFVVNGGIVPGTIPSDNGTSMTSKPVTALLAAMGIVKSHSRPKVSNDNPYSEAQFKILKYCPAFPVRFDSLDEAETFCHHFFDYYNHRHHHAGIGLHTPFTMHIGTAQAIQHKRAATIEAFRAANPRRFTQTPTLPKIPTVAQINRPDEDTTDPISPGQEKHAA